MADKKKNRTYKPEKQTLRLTKKLLPELEGIDVGDVVTITLKVKMCSKAQGEEYGDYAWEADEYGEKYAEDRKADRAQLRGTFEVLEADEDGQDTPEQAAAKKIMADRKRKRII